MLHDLIVIGAGPAGAATALRAADRGLSVMLLEQNRFPRMKTCTGCLSNKSLLHLSELGLSLPGHLVRGRVTGVALWAEGKQQATPDERQVGVVVDRDRFDHWLVGEAQKRGVTFRDGAAVRGVEQTTSGVDVQTRHERFYGRWVVGADGVGGPTARLAGIRGRWAWWELGTTWSSTLPQPPATNHAILALCNIPTTWGWVFPREDGVHIGLGGAQFLGDALRRGFEQWVRTYADRSGIELPELRSVRYPVPAGGFRRRVAARRVLLTGDAAGLVDPFAGEGIHLALASGRQAADCISHDWHGDAASAYQSWVDGLLPELRLSLCLSIALGTRGPLVGRAMCCSDRAAKALASWMAGESSYRELIRQSLVPSP